MNRLRSLAFEASLLFGDIAEMLALLAVCRVLGHGETIIQPMSTGKIGVCSRCSSTVSPG
jgi:hypothetical protein